MYLIQLAIEYGAPLFLISSPLTSYLDQILSIHRNRSSAGFSLDIPLIMLVASILKVFYWFGEYYSKALLAQAVVMIFVQMALLKVALDNRPAVGAKNGIEHTPFSGGSHGGFNRPYDFWQWKNTKPYWLFLAYFVAVLTVFHLTPISDSPAYISLLGAVGLAVEAILPLPQILANHRSGSCNGFRVSVLAAWILGDTMKMSYFFCSQETIPWAFKLCGMFQCVCDLYLGFQYWMFTRSSGQAAGSSVEQEGRWGQEEKDIRMN
ncbi:PQ loop repeat protein [Penicillium brasilianum]|uniref:PQ loop repeat protein n=1 Tax=Penicillium brasilianum TaxID=104259 RepID=A0A1S9RJB4_PENBI|nr:PQ loop repeat protein [Penicillium brasilianum]